MEQVVARGVRLGRLAARDMRASSGVRPPLRWLHERQALTRLSHEWRPPRWRGTTWSSVRSRVRTPQYWQAW